MVFKINRPLFILFLLPLILILIWFRHGNIMATGESGIPFYDPNLQYEINKSAWAAYTLGHPTNISVASAPTYWFLSQLYKFSIPPFLIQASFFWLILVSSAVGIYFLTKEFFPKLEKKYFILTVFFYWFNPFSLVNVWNRFLNNFFLFYAFLPLVLLLFIKGINSQKYIYAVLIGILSVIFSYAASSITLNILLWIILLYTTALYIFLKPNWSLRFFISKFFVFTLIFWALMNFWWISQVFSYISSGSFNAVSTSSFTKVANYQTFVNLSQALGNISDLIRGRHDYFFNESQVLWAKIFNFPIFIFFDFTVAAIILLPVIFKKNLSSFFAGGLFLLGIFLTKGNNPPFGEVNDALFFSSPLMQLFRNPFEKFGFILGLSSTLLFTQGLIFITTMLGKKARELLYSSIFVIVTIVWGMPFWTGFVFVGGERPINDHKIGYQVKVPPSYKQASEWLRSQTGDFRLLVFPIGGEGITYSWEKGYSGVELTNQLLPKTAVSFNTNIPFYKEVSENLEKHFLKKDSLKLLSNALNAEYILYRPDIDWEIRKMRNPQKIQSILEEKRQKEELKKIAQFGELVFYKILNKDKDKIYLTSSTFLNYSRGDIADLEFSKSGLVISPQEISGILPSMIEGEIIRPHAQFFLERQIEPVFEIRQDIFPYVGTLPKDKIYKLVLIKDRMEEETIKDREELLEHRIILLGKRLAEAKLSYDLNDENGVKMALSGYNVLLGRTFGLLTDLYTLDREDKQTSLQSRVYPIFSRHIKVLEDLKAEGILKSLTTKLTEAQIYPFFGFKQDLQFPLKRRKVYLFQVRELGEYELLWDDKILDGFYKIIPGDEIILQIDDKLSKRKLEPDAQGHVSLGKIYLEKGNHEIGLNLPEEINLLDTSDIHFKVDHGRKVHYFNVKNYDSYASYSISFDYWIKKGNGVNVLVYDKGIDNINSNTIPYSKFIVGPDLYDYTPKNFFKGFKLPDGADQASLALEVLPWNDCETIFYFNRRERCKNEAFRRPYDKTTEIDVSNISISRNFSDLPILARKNPVNFPILPQSDFKKLDNTTYLVDIKDASNPYFLTFSELYDPGWQLLEGDGKVLDYQHFLANGYANSWYIEKEGSYQMTLKFMPQKILEFGQKVSFVTVSLGLIFVTFNILRKKHV